MSHARVQNLVQLANPAMRATYGCIVKRFIQLFLYYRQFPGGWILVSNFVMDSSTAPNN